ncbi:hypothetical protein CAPTEDRAFT_154890 [Capitella teleta]|uniref:Calponin-homology (CH) domain-containing protein n=1 Tax=Capitella teleta TaxID=283909 RepID=R7TKL5_CAPTE|nr:hypothetical protein CAPTEDRAFT_154890 [Capitella teleta]|eukprot:ELT94042.1 hypothetical protein CAPTEDRAFT_154890 [Capitella teleta]
MSGLTRDVLKWLQSLDLTWQVKYPKWDLTNGYLVAEIFSWYFPQEVEMHMFYNQSDSLELKLRNWSLLKNFIKRHSIDIPAEFIEGTIHCKENAAQLLVERMYQLLTNREIRKVTQDEMVDFTDGAYQNKLPMHARSTASQAIKNNLKETELMADQSLILGQQKTHSIISDHLDNRRKERLENPSRFNKKPTLGELAVRRGAPSTSSEPCSWDKSETSFMQENEIDHKASRAPSREPTVTFKEVQVQQVSRPSTNHASPIAGF